MKEELQQEPGMGWRARSSWGELRGAGPQGMGTPKEGEIKRQQVFTAFLLGSGRPSPESNHSVIQQIFIELSGEEQDSQSELVLGPGLKSLQSSGKGQWAKLCHLPAGRSTVLGAEEPLL